MRTSEEAYLKTVSSFWFLIHSRYALKMPSFPRAEELEGKAKEYTKTLAELEASSGNVSAQVGASPAPHRRLQPFGANWACVSGLHRSNTGTSPGAPTGPQPRI